MPILLKTPPKIEEERHSKIHLQKFHDSKDKGHNMKDNYRSKTSKEHVSQQYIKPNSLLILKVSWSPHEVQR